MLGIRLLGEPSPDLQLIEGRKVHKRVAGDDGDGIVVQLPMDESQEVGE